MNLLRRGGLFLLLAAVVLSLVILTSSLSKMQMNSGLLFDPSTRGKLNLLFAQFNAYRGMILVCVGIIPLFLLLLAWINNTRTKRSSTMSQSNPIVTLIQLIFFAIAFFLFRKKIIDNSTNILSPKPINPPKLSSESNFTRIFIDTPEILNYFVGFVLLIGLFLALAWYVQKQRRSSSQLERIAIEAQTALDDIERGADLRNVILNCYHEMTHTVEIHRGEKRPSGMTPSEFKLRLVKLGLPETPVTQLTQLFEDVRYGAREAGSDAEVLARSSLTAIVTACKGL